MSPDAPPARSTAWLIGGALALLSVALFIGLLVVAARGRPEATAVPNAMLYVDVRGRIAVDGKTVADGPAPIPVVAGTRRLTFLDQPPERGSVTVTVAPGAFSFVPRPEGGYGSLPGQGSIVVAAFPPDSTIEIPDCTPKDAPRPVICRGTREETAQVSPGTYTLRYSHPQFGTREERVEVAAGQRVHRAHSFIATVAAFEAWWKTSGAVLERYGGRGYRRGGADLFALPFHALGEVTDELFGVD